MCIYIHNYKFTEIAKNKKKYKTSKKKFKICWTRPKQCRQTWSNGKVNLIATDKTLSKLS